MSATIKYKGNTIASITTDSSKTLKTSGKYCEGDIVVENVQDGGITPSGNKAITATTSTQTGIDVTNYATVSVAPTPSETKSVTTNGDVMPSSGKLLSKVTVNVPTGTERDSSDITVSGATVNVPAGLYSSAASKSVASGTAGTPTASKGAVSNNSVTVTPSVANTTGYITGGTKTGTGVTVSASELVSGNKAITPSETAQSGIDVTNFKTVSVGAITPSIVGNLDASSFAPSIVAAVEGKGVTVPDATLLDGMAALIESIEAGGGGSGIVYTSGTLVFSSNTTCDGYVITHDLGTIPQIFIISIQYSTSGDFGLMHHFVISEGLRNMGYSADKYCLSFFNNGVGSYRRYTIENNKNYTIDENTITIMHTNNGVFLSGKHYSWQAIGGIAV